MKSYKGQVETVNSSSTKVYEFLSDFNNFTSFLPPQIEDWECNELQCSFSIQGLGKLKLNFKEKTPNSLIIVQPAPESGLPIEFFIKILINQLEENDKCNFQFIVEADINPMISMLVDKPLKQFVEVITQRTKLYFS